MPSVTFLLLVATVLSVEDGVARIDLGRQAGLRPGDAGTFYYELTVGSQTRRVDVGTGTLRDLDEHESRVEIAAGAAVRSGNRIELRIPVPPEIGRELLRRGREARPGGDVDAAPAAAPADSGPAMTAAAAVRDLITRWAASWSDQRVDDYLSFYARDFRPPGGVSRDAWESRRRERISSPGSIEIELQRLEIVTVADRAAVATFGQSYRSDSYRDEVSKLLDLVREDGEWKILEETVLASPAGSR